MTAQDEAAAEVAVLAVVLALAAAAGVVTGLALRALAARSTDPSRLDRRARA